MAQNAQAVIPAWIAEIQCTRMYSSTLHLLKLKLQINQLYAL